MKINITKQWQGVFDNLRSKNIKPFSLYSKKRWKNYFNKIEEAGGSICISDDDEIEILMPKEMEEILKIIILSDIRHKNAKFYVNNKFLVISF